MIGKYPIYQLQEPQPENHRLKILNTTRQEFLETHLRLILTAINVLSKRNLVSQKASSINSQYSA